MTRLNSGLSRCEIQPAIARRRSASGVAEVSLRSGRMPRTADTARGGTSSPSVPALPRRCTRMTAGLPARAVNIFLGLAPSMFRSP